MKAHFISISALFLCLTSGVAQVSSTPPSGNNSAIQAVSSNELASGTILEVELSKSLDARKIKANDKFEARTAVDLLSHGQIVIPRNTKIIGHVTEAKAHSNQSPDSVVGIVFDKAVLKNGRELPLQASVQALGRPLLTATAFPPDDQPGMPTPAAGQRGSRIGSAAGPSIPNPGGYPSSAASGVPPDMPPAPKVRTVSPLGPTSKGVVGIKGLTLDSSGAASVVSSKTDERASRRRKPNDSPACSETVAGTPTVGEELLGLPKIDDVSDKRLPRRG